LTAALNAVITGPPFAVAEKLDPGAIHQQAQRAVDAMIRDLDGERLLPSAQGRIVRQVPVQVGIFSRMGTIPIVCLSGSSNRTLMVRQSWIAASEHTAGRPGPPSNCASQVISLFKHISKDPRLRGEAVKLDQFVVR
jgi:hypothetical protein